MGVVEATADRVGTAPLRGPKDYAELFGITIQTLLMWEKDGKFPRAIHIGKRRYWRPEVVERWLEAQ